MYANIVHTCYYHTRNRGGWHKLPRFQFRIAYGNFYDGL